MTPRDPGRPPQDRHFLPVGLDLRDLPCVVVGGGPIGTRKALALHRVGARVTVVAPRITRELEEAARAGRITWIAETFRSEHLWGAFLVVVATDDPNVNTVAGDAARRDGALLCDATSGERSRIIFGATLRHDEATVAVFTDGRDPARARRTRDRIADLLKEDRRPASTLTSGREPC